MCLIPLEVLELIALYAIADEFLGPPSVMARLVVLNRKTYRDISFQTNQHLWARIFALKFDVVDSDRIGPRCNYALARALELKKRYGVMKRLRSRTDVLADSLALSASQEDFLREELWTVYIMMLENGGKNERQLREYAGIDKWLKDYLFDPAGASLARLSIQYEIWPPENERVSLAIWLFWLLFRPEAYMVDDATFRDANNVLKLYALGAHQYPMCLPPWQELLPNYPASRTTTITYYGRETPFLPPTPSAPAILSYFTLANKLSVSWDTINYMKPPTLTIPSSVASLTREQWSAEWARTALSGGFDGASVSAFVSGSLEGVWEGLFTYTEFTGYAALLSGAPPTVLQRSLVAQHPHLWKVREFHLYESEDAATAACPVSPGDPLRAYIPQGAEIRETSAGLEVLEPGKSQPMFYTRWTSKATDSGKPRKTKDVFLAGEGHSAWGQFNLVGRVRPCDGFFSLCKNYVDGDRGKWLYRGYLVGNQHGNISGRWRDTLSPADVVGYEGCFVMSRRR